MAEGHCAAHGHSPAPRSVRPRGAVWCGRTAAAAACAASRHLWKHMRLEINMPHHHSPPPRSRSSHRWVCGVAGARRQLDARSGDDALAARAVTVAVLRVVGIDYVCRPAGPQAPAASVAGAPQLPSPHPQAVHGGLASARLRLQSAGWDHGAPLRRATPGRQRCWRVRLPFCMRVC
jgi:hypothetical protein